MTPHPFPPETHPGHKSGHKTPRRSHLRVFLLNICLPKLDYLGRSLKTFLKGSSCFFQSKAVNIPGCRVRICMSEYCLNNCQRVTLFVQDRCCQMSYCVKPERFDLCLIAKTLHQVLPMKKWFSVILLTKGCFIKTDKHMLLVISLLR